MRRRFLSPSWLLRHALALALVVAFVLLGRWQWHRAEAGNGLSVAYTIEWPLFALFVAFFWWKMVHFELHPPQPTEDADPVEAAPVSPPPAESVAPPTEPVDARAEPELAAYNDYLARLAEQDGAR